LRSRSAAAHVVARRRTSSHVAARLRALLVTKAEQGGMFTA